MAGHKYLSDSKTLFFDDEDVDDETFLQNSRRFPSSQVENFDKHQYLQQKRVIEERTVQSTTRSINLLRESEQIGIATAEELMRQREQLEKSDKRLDEINATLRFSQKHINGIKSVFGSLKNYLSGRNEPSAPKSTQCPEVEENKRKFQESTSSLDPFLSNQIRELEDARPHSEIQAQASGSKSFSEVLNDNLGEMYGQISRLKGLATDLSEEIDSQNDLIINLIDKTETADMSLDKQVKEMKKILNN